MKLADLIEELIEARIELQEAEKDNKEAMEKYLDNGGMSWGYHGQSYYDRVDEARDKVNKIKEKINNVG